MTRYASQTSVSPERSRAEIESILVRYGADAFGYLQEAGRAAIQFRCNGRMVRFMIEMPSREEFETTETGRARQASAAFKAWQQACRQRWRALALVIKAKLEAIESGIAEFDAEFLPYIVLPNGQTVGEWALPQVARAYEVGDMPRMSLPAAKDEDR